MEHHQDGQTNPFEGHLFLDLSSGIDLNVEARCESSFKAGNTCFSWFWRSFAILTPIFSHIFSYFLIFSHIFSGVLC